MKNFKGFLFAVVAFAALTLSASAQSSLPSLGGGRVDLDAQKGKVVILAVGATWLPLSIKQAEYANALAKRYTGKNVVIYFIATDSTVGSSKNFASDEDVRKFVGTSKLAITVLRDSDGALTLKRYNLDQLPSFVILDKQGRQAGEAFGGIDPKFDVTIPVSKAVDGLL
ncbi:MAG: TlpA family protein disulfide reductase [Pyrinomonadaceae bacterium]